MDLSDPHTFERAYAEHARGVFAAAHRILGNAAQAQDVTQDVFLRIWRRPDRFDATPRRARAASFASWRAAARSTSGARATPPAAPPIG